MAVTPEEATQNYLLAKNSPIAFIDNFCYLQNPTTLTTERFRTWPFQAELIKFWQENALTVTLKARQLGISWLVMAFADWLVNFNDNVVVLCISQNERKAMMLIDKIRFMHDRLPSYLAKPIARSNLSEIVFEGGSKIVALPSTPGNAVSYTATVVVVDEWAEQEYAEQTFAALEPTINAGGRVIGISTGSTSGSFFHGLWKNARARLNGFEARFLYYWYRPGRSCEKAVCEHPQHPNEWYENTLRRYPDEQEFHRQYPRNEVEAFISAGGCPFSVDTITWYMDNVVAPPLDKEEIITKRAVPDDLVQFLDFDDLLFWELPRAGEAYIITSDPASGEEGRDFSATQVLKQSSLEQVAELRTRRDLDIYTNATWELARFYNNGLLVVERNNHGAAVLNLLINHKFYPHLYQHEEFDEDPRTRKRKQTRKHGWPATVVTNSLRDNSLIGACREHAITIRSERWWDEAKSFVRMRNGTYGAEGNSHDDLVVAMGMAYIVAMQSLNIRHSGPARVVSRKRKTLRERWA